MPADQLYCEIPLTKGYVALVDSADFPFLNQWRWKAKVHACGKVYAIRSIWVCGGKGKTRTVMMHREVLGLEFGDKRHGDHIEPRSTLDNRRGNLRIATAAQNARNRVAHRNSKTGIKGISYRARDRRYEAKTHFCGKHIWIGSFKTAEEAHAAYAEVAKKLHGEFVRLV